MVNTQRHWSSWRPWREIRINNWRRGLQSARKLAKGRQRLGLRRVMEITLTATTSYISALWVPECLRHICCSSGERSSRMYMPVTLKPFSFHTADKHACNPKGTSFSEGQVAGDWEEIYHKSSVDNPYETCHWGVMTCLQEINCPLISSKLPAWLLAFFKALKFWPETPAALLVTPLATSAWERGKEGRDEILVSTLDAMSWRLANWEWSREILPSIFWWQTLLLLIH